MASVNANVTVDLSEEDRAAIETVRRSVSERADVLETAITAMQEVMAAVQLMATRVDALAARIEALENLAFPDRIDCRYASYTDLDSCEDDGGVAP